MGSNDLSVTLQRDEKRTEDLARLDGVARDGFRECGVEDALSSFYGSSADATLNERRAQTYDDFFPTVRSKNGAVKRVGTDIRWRHHESGFADA